MTMKQWILSALVFGASMTTALAQTTTDSLRAQTSYRPLSTGDLYQGMSKTIPSGRVVLPYGLEVTFDKTSHLIFPSAIRYVDLGSNKLIAGKAEDAENVLRVKAAVRDFETETNMSVICEDGSFYAFNVKYAEEPEKLSIEMADFLSSTEGRLPSNRADIYFKELGSESPILVKLMMKTIHQNDQRTVKHIGVRQFGIRFLLRGLYAHKGLLYLHTRIDNETNLSYSVDFISFKPVEGASASDGQFQVRIQLPTTAGGVATSGNYRNFKLVDGKKVAHTIDPRTGYPIQTDILSITILAPSCMLADGLATACMTCRAEEVPALVKHFSGVEYMLILGDGKDGFRTLMSPGFERLVLADYALLEIIYRQAHPWIP